MCLAWLRGYFVQNHVCYLLSFNSWIFFNLLAFNLLCIMCFVASFLPQKLESMQPLRPYEKLDTLQQFLDYDRHVLRFFCRWDDSPSMFGDVRWLVLHYFLADDTVEVLEKIPANSGRDAVPVFLRRARLHKVWRHSHLSTDSVDVFSLSYTHG